MIVELANHDKLPGLKYQKFGRTKKRFFPHPLLKINLQSVKAEELGINERFPTIHREEPGASDAFHSENVLP